MDSHTHNNIKGYHVHHGEDDAEQEIRTGAPFSLRNDDSKIQTGVVFIDICTFYNIGSETTEPLHPEQNPAENRIGILKKVTNRLNLLGR